MEIVPHEGIHEYKMYDGDDDEVFITLPKLVENIGLPSWASCYSENRLACPLVARSLSVYC